MHWFRNTFRRRWNLRIEGAAPLVGEDVAAVRGLIAHIQVVVCRSRASLVAVVVTQAGIQLIFAAWSRGMQAELLSEGVKRVPCSPQPVRRELTAAAYSRSPLGPRAEMGAAGSMQGATDVECKDTQIRIGLRGESQWSSIIGAKWAKEPFLSVVIIPFLKMLRKESIQKGAALQTLASVHINDELISLNHAGKSVYSTTASVLSMGHSDSAVNVTIQLHTDVDSVDSVARPQHFLRRLATKLPFFEANTACYHVFLGEVGSATELNQKWQEKSAMEALVLPFLEVRQTHHSHVAHLSCALNICSVLRLRVVTLPSRAFFIACLPCAPAFDSQFYNSLGVGPEVKAEHVAGLTIEGVVEPTGPRALTASPKDFVGLPGSTTSVHVILSTDVADAVQARQRTSHETVTTQEAHSQAQQIGSHQHHTSAALNNQIRGGVSSSEARERLNRIAVLEKRMAEADADNTPLSRILGEIRFVRSS